MVALVLLCLLLTILLLRFLRTKNRLPPGPPQVPLLGCLPYLDLSKGFLSWLLDPRVTRHPLATVRLGPKQIFVINNLQLAREVFDRDEFHGTSPDKLILTHRFWNNIPRGIIFTSGSQHTTQRRFGLKTLKDFGFGRKSIENSIHFEVDEMLDQVFSCDGDILLGSDFNIPIINILWQMVAGKRFSANNKKDNELMERVIVLFTLGQFSTLLPFFLYNLLPKSIAKRTVTGKRADSLIGIREYLIAEVKSHQDNLDSKNPEDFIDVYLSQMDKEEDLNIMDLIACIHDFFVAGTETSSTTLKWMLLHLTLHQGVQDRCRDEICSVLGESRVSVSDMSSLPYVQATIAEVQRLSCVGPMSLPHTTTAPTNVQGFNFPKGSVFVANLSFIMSDPNFINNPKMFNPSRFLTEEGRFVKSERLVPFGIGRRNCMGEVLARNEVFMFTVDLLQRRRFLPAPLAPLPHPSRYTTNLTSIPDNFHLTVVKL